MSNLTQIQSENEFHSIIKGSKVVVVDFFTVWCGPCKAIAGYYLELSKTYKNIKFLKVDCDKLKQLAQSQGVQAFPTFIFYVNGVKNSMIKGGNRQLLDSTCKKLSQQYPSSVFSKGKGYKMTDTSSSKPKPIQQAATKKRFNPWADPEFVNNRLNKSKKPVETTTSSTSSSITPATTPATTPSVQTTSVAAANEVNQMFLQQLVSMGFDPQQSTNALKQIKNSSLDAAINILTSSANNDTTTVMDTSTDDQVNDKPMDVVTDIVDDNAELDDDMLNIVNNLKKERIRT